MSGRTLFAGRRIAAATGLLWVALLSGCSWVQNEFTNDPAIAEGNKRRTITTPGEGPTFDLWTECIPAERQSDGACPGGSTLKLINRYIADGDDRRAAFLRDRLQDYLMMRSDQMCEKHRSGILSTQAVTNFAMNTVTTGLTATAALVVAPATNILAALGAITTGTRSAFNADIYQKYVAPAVVKKINDTREEKRKEIVAKRYTQPADASKPREIKPVTLYTPEAAVGDVEIYNQYCSFAWGLASLGDSNPRFADTAAGVQQRIDTLRKQQLDNKTQMEKLGVNTPEARRLGEVNQDISKQILILQHQLLTAPTSVDPKPAGGG